MGVRLRTTLTATAAVAVALCLASIALFAALDASLADSTKESALQDAQARAAKQGFVLMESVKAGGVPGGKLPLPVTGPAAGVPYGVIGSSGPGGASPLPRVAGVPVTKTASGGTSLTEKRPGTAAGSGKLVVPVSYSATKGANGQLVITQVLQGVNGTVTVQGSAPLAPARQAMRTLTRLLIPGVPALLALVALFSWLAVGRALRPVSAIRAKVADITAYGLHERVPEPATRDEIAALARTVNATLDRLRTAVDAHRQFVADAAHELRSPMAILRTRLELAGPQEKALAEEALADVARLQTLTSDLLLLARLDARRPLRVRELDLAQLVAEEAARRRPRLEVRVLLDLAPDLLILGSPDHLRRLVANLVDNAVRHATTTVRVTLARRPDGHLVLDVIDDGDGIPPAHHATVFQRFTRLDAARSRDTGGSGLGLPIARDIATAHAATLSILPSTHGAHFQAVFPEGAPSSSLPAPEPVPAPVLPREHPARRLFRAPRRASAASPPS
ncbi:sensor histidine kinase [Actinacidiphila acididurans]|uniref:histidine kinase n=1 Tax=Actinacidiphila acididurans TaxID=2784346 RepID=A0ABS2U0C7_9ACTN|nr:HAMP domain-containing sensor histidine kinase [Actinacidiphila acididurans]MBM9509031.1 HAMP domain-containing histidine kinase [Actinacidiphila acididurans]